MSHMLSAKDLLKVQNLRVALPSPAAATGWVEPVRGISFSLKPGETMGLVGESGCGKSMTALALMGLLPEPARTQGKLLLGEQDLTTATEPQLNALRGKRMAMVFQEPMTALNPLHTVGQQIAEGLRIHEGLDRAAARKKALELLERVAMPQAAQRLDAYPHQLSGGQRQRVGIAIALACDPDLLVADEPTTALDVTVQAQILALIEQLVRESAMALVLISHDLRLVAKHVDKVAVMYAGQIVESGPVAQVFASPAHPYTQGLLSARPSLTGTRGQPLVTIQGTVPALHELQATCAFAPRCPQFQASCTAAPLVASRQNGRELLCIRASV